MSRRPSYPEELLHWVWETSRLELDRLITTDGQAISLYQTGTLNKADGPDFLNAQIQIGSLKWFGDIEIHWSTQDWFNHSHHKDPNYNRVILHVVWNHDQNKNAIRQDHTGIPTLVLKDCISKPLRSFLSQYLKSDALPCSGKLSFISREAFKEQIHKATRQYFEQKVNDLFAFWDSSLPPSKAWQKMLALGLFDGLGISHNRDPMRKLCRELYPLPADISSKPELISLALSKAGVHSDTGTDRFGWNHKGSRPANHPRVRIQQAASCLWFIDQLPFKNWLRADFRALWEELNQQITVRPGIGKQRKDILFGTVWLPSLFILGSTFASNSIQARAFEVWETYRAEIPSSLLKPFRSLGLPASDYQQSLGAVYQLRTYCKPRHCERCKVFKSVISS